MTGAGALARSGRRAAAALLALPLQAQTTFVSNTGQSDSGSTLVGVDGTRTRVKAQQFTTGDNEDGYTLSEVIAKLSSVGNNTLPRVSLYSNVSNDPGSSLHVLTNPASISGGNNTFTAPANVTLVKETKYWVVFESTATTDGSSYQYSVRVETSGNEDSGASSGWSIRDSYDFRNQPTGDWDDASSIMLIAINGQSLGLGNAAPTFDDGTSTTREFLDESIGTATADTVTRTDIGQPVAATDTDTGDTLEYTLSGTDAAKFTIDTTSGQIRDKGGENYDYEAKASYAVTVTVMDGNGGSDTIAVTLNLLDQDEPPLQPVAPNMTEHNDITKFNIRLTPPDNTGRPNISEYRARFHAPGFVWTMSNWTTSLNRIAGGVISGVRYTVQYRARNDEGEGPWSPSGFFSTIAHATGAPDITGTARVGQTLTAGTSGISDGNGKSKAENGDVGFAYTYQWVRSVSGTDTNITGETASTYTLTAADMGNKVKVKVSFTDNAGYSEGPLTSDAYPSSGSVREACDGVWCATLNVTTLNGNHLGCANSQSGNACSNPSRLTEDEFTHASTSYSVTSVQDRTNGQLQLWINPDITSASLKLVLHVGTDTFNFQDADTKGANNRYWNNAGLSWSSGGAVELKLSEAPAATDATLSALALVNNNGAAIALTPGFVTGTKSYTAMVAMGVSSITLTPAVNESNATVAYLNASDAAITDTDLNTPALDAPLVVGDNTFKVKVTAEDTTTTDTYTVVVTRAASNTAATGTPSIDGTPQVGLVLTAAKGTLADADGTTKADNGDTGYAYSYQ